MPVDSPHPDYSLWAPLWQLMRDVTAGEYAVKAKTTTYLPSLFDMNAADYADYLMSARFYAAASRTIQGFTGMIFRVPPVIEVPVAMEPWLRDIDLAGQPIESLLKKETQDKLTTGRYGLRVDMQDEGNRPYISVYTTENIVNWKEELVNGLKVPTLVVLRETETNPTDDEFIDDTREVYHVLDLVEGRCRVRIFRFMEQTRSWTVELLAPPSKQGEVLDFIPFVFDNVTDLSPDLEKPPLLDLASVNLGHYRLTADYYDAIKFTSKPQPWVSGYTGEEREFRIGSRYAWLLPTGATTGYLEYSGAGIADIRQALNDDEQRMARLGAAVIEEPKAGVESAETSRINQAGKASVLSSLAGTTSQAMTQALRYMAWWGGMSAMWDDPAITCTLNQDFIEARLSPQDLLALVQSWQARGISQQTLVFNVKRGGLLPDSITVDEEVSLISMESPPMPTTEEMPLDQDEQEQDDEEDAA